MQIHKIDKFPADNGPIALPTDCATVVNVMWRDSHGTTHGTQDLVVDKIAGEVKPKTRWPTDVHDDSCIRMNYVPE